jgi:hypothetical protein
MAYKDQTTGGLKEEYRDEPSLSTRNRIRHAGILIFLAALLITLIIVLITIIF